MNTTATAATAKSGKQPARIHFAVSFPACGAEFHPSFKHAKQLSDGTYLLEYPIHVKGILKAKRTQKVWAEYECKHLRSWGIKPTIVELT